MSLESVVCSRVEVPPSGSSVVWMSSTEFGVSECDCEDSIRRDPGPLRAVAPWGGGNMILPS
jgi:hypothetical protein